jgi:hypothetical protein
MKRLFVLAALLVSAVPMLALNLSGSPTIIPVVGRFAGAGGTQWRTDVFVTNPSNGVRVVTLKFYQSGGPLREHTFAINPFSSVTLPDIVLNTFGQTSAAGMLAVSVPPPFGTLARATIYNTGNPAGRFGQGVPGIALDYLNRQAYLFGLSGIDGTRLNIGVANPNDIPVTVSIQVFDSSNTSLASREVTVAAHAYVQYNDIFATFGITPQAGVTVQMNTFDPLVNRPIYGYASEVRNDTGDAIFSFGTSPNA